MSKNGKLSIRVWAGILLFMFMGSLAWNVENIYFNTFLNDMVFDKGSMGAALTLTDAVNIMVSGSALVAVITTFIMGTLSEKMKNRKAFISFGYIAWGIVIMLFGFISKDKMVRMLGLTSPTEAVTITAWVVIVMDMVMTFMGSTSNDSAFNAWVTDVTTPETTPKVETAFTFIGFIAMGLIMGIGSLAQSGIISYSVFFVGLGVFVTLVGIIGIFLLENPKKFEEAKKNNDENKTSYWADLFYGFRPSAIKENKNLYLILLSGCTFNSAFQVFFPYLFIYLGSVVIPANEDVDMLSAGVIIPAVLAVIGVVAGIIVFMKIANKNKASAFIPCVLILVIGLLILSSTKSILGMIAGVAPTLVGYIVTTTQFAANVRNNIPQDKVGLFQGIRMIFLVLIPMVIGPTLGNIATKNSDITYIDNGVQKVLPTESMFLYAAVVAALIFIPMLAFLKNDKAKEKALKEEQSE